MTLQYTINQVMAFYEKPKEIEHVLNKICQFIVLANKRVDFDCCQANHTQYLFSKTVRIGADLFERKTYVNTDSLLLVSTSRMLANRFEAWGLGFRGFVI